MILQTNIADFSVPLVKKEEKNTAKLPSDAPAAPGSGINDETIVTKA